MDWAGLLIKVVVVMPCILWQVEKESGIIKSVI